MFHAIKSRGVGIIALLVSICLLALLLAPLSLVAAQADDPCPIEPQAKLVWMSPRGTLEVMDDYPLWVAKEMGYFEELGLDVELQPGVSGGPTGLATITEGLADAGYPSPGVITAAIDTGIPIIIGFEMAPGQVFDFAVAADSDIETVADLEGKTIALWDVSGANIVAPILAEQGIDPESITYVGSGQWGQLVQQGQADAALAWEGLRAQWDSIGLDFRYLIGSDFSTDPSNGYAIRASDLEDPAKAAIMTCFLRGVSMGLEFGRVNPQAAAAITYAQFPAVQEQMTPDLALESMRQLMWLYNQTHKDGLGYGYSDMDNWQSYLDRVFTLGQTTRQLTAEETVSNQLIEGANAFDTERVAADAAAYELAPEWADLELQGDVE
ncbi:MAG: ABC transporter substrate-binding protein [Chloroflexota bacterium]